MGKEIGGEALGELLSKDGFTAGQVEPVCDFIGGSVCSGARGFERAVAGVIEDVTQPFYDAYETVTDELLGIAAGGAAPLCNEVGGGVCEGIGDAVLWVRDYLFLDGRLERLRGGITGFIADEIDSAVGIAETINDFTGVGDLAIDGAELLIVGGELVVDLIGSGADTIGDAFSDGYDIVTDFFSSDWTPW